MLETLCVGQMAGLLADLHAMVFAVLIKELIAIFAGQFETIHHLMCCEPDRFSALPPVPAPVAWLHTARDEKFAALLQRH